MAEAQCFCKRAHGDEKLVAGLVPKGLERNCLSVKIRGQGDTGPRDSERPGWALS
jgi:hypothetical protein